MGIKIPSGYLPHRLESAMLGLLICLSVLVCWSEAADDSTVRDSLRSTGLKELLANPGATAEQLDQALAQLPEATTHHEVGRHWNLHLQLILRLMADEPDAEERDGIWSLRQARLVGLESPVAISPEGFAALDRLLPLMKPDDQLTLARFWDDLLALPIDPASHRLLQFRRARPGLLRRQTESPAIFIFPDQNEDANLLLRQEALALMGSPQPNRALRWTAAAERNAHGLLGAQVMASHLEALLRQFPPSADEIEEAWVLLDQRNQLASAEIWNLSLRLLLRQVYAADQLMKVNTWREGIERLRGHASSVVLSAAALADVDRFVGFSEAERGVGTEQVLTDLLLLLPELSSMQQLARRRTQVLIAHRAAKGTSGSLTLEAVLAAAGPEPVLGDVLQRGAEMERHKLAAPSIFKPGADDDASTTVIAFDAALTTAANHQLQISMPAPENTPHSVDALRRRTLLQLLAGKPDKGFSWGDRLIRASSAQNLDQNLRLMRCVSVALAGHLRSADQYLEVLIGDPTIDPALRNMLFPTVSTEATGSFLPIAAYPDYGRFGELPVEAQLRLLRQRHAAIPDRFAAWASDAYSRGLTPWATAFWADAINRTPGTLEAERRLQAISDQIRTGASPQQGSVLLQQLQPKLKRSADRLMVQVLLASVAYEQGEFERSLSLLADKKALTQLTSRMQLTAGLMRAVSQIKLGDLNTAAELLIELTQLDGDDESEAQVRFLRGWIHLSENNVHEAQQEFRIVIDRYPGTTSATKAQGVLQRLQTPAQ